MFLYQWCIVLARASCSSVSSSSGRVRYRLADLDRFEAELLLKPGKAPLMPLPHQVAQKIHALTGGDDRVRDLIDLQLIASNETVDLEATCAACERLFSYRKKQEWPPTVTRQPG